MEHNSLKLGKPLRIFTGYTDKYEGETDPDKKFATGKAVEDLYKEATLEATPNKIVKRNKDGNISVGTLRGKALPVEGRNTDTDFYKRLHVSSGSLPPYMVQADAENVEWYEGYTDIAIAGTGDGKNRPIDQLPVTNGKGRFGWNEKKHDINSNSKDELATTFLTHQLLEKINNTVIVVAHVAFNEKQEVKFSKNVKKVTASQAGVFRVEFQTPLANTNYYVLNTNLLYFDGQRTNKNFTGMRINNPEPYNFFNKTTTSFDVMYVDEKAIGRNYAVNEYVVISTQNNTSTKNAYNPLFNNIYIGQLPKSSDNVTDTKLLSEKENKCQVICDIGTEDEHWEYRTDPLPDQRQLCDWVENEGYVINQERYKAWQRDELCAEYLPKIEELEKAGSGAALLENDEELAEIKTALKSTTDEFNKKLEKVELGETIETTCPDILCPKCRKVLMIDESGKKFCKRCGWHEE